MPQEKRITGHEGFSDSLVRNSPAIAGITGDKSGRSSWVRKIPKGKNGNLLPYSSLENSMDREAWQAI